MKPRYVPNIDPLVYPAIRLADQVPRVIHEFIPKIVEEEVVRNNLLGFFQRLLGRLKVELHIQLFEERRHRIGVLIFLHLDDLDDLSYRVPNSGRLRWSLAG